MLTVFWGIVLALCTSISVSAVATGEPVCPSVVYLKDGIGGKIPCLCGSFTIVAWYNEEEFDGDGSPIINYDKVQKGGQGFFSGEYDITENGSLIISNVTRNHDGVFIVTVADDFQRREDEIRIRVIVVVPAVPVYPAINGKVNQQHVHLGVNRKGVLTCAMSGVYPAVNLTFKSHSDKIKFEHQNMSKMLQQNNKYDVTLSTNYTVTDLSIERLTIFCEVADDEIADQFPDKTMAILVLEPVYPVVNGYTNQEHVYLDKIDRVGQLNCMKKKVPVGTSLTWEVADSSLQGRVSIESFPAMSDNNDGTVDITQMVNYTVDNSVNRILLLCKVGQPDTEQLLATKVDLLFENVYPVVNGHANLEHIYMDVDREGQLTCLKESVKNSTRLVWKIMDQTMEYKMTFKCSGVTSYNDDGTITMKQVLDYAAHDQSLERISLECRVVEADTHEHVATRVDLLLKSVYPVVNGYISQKYVYIDAQREGQLTCFMESIDAACRLSWEIPDPAWKDRISFQSTTFHSYNHDGTININGTFEYTIHDSTLERISVECRVIEPEANQHPHFTTVVLLFSDAAVIDGCYSQQDQCSLDVGESGELTCSVKNSPYPVNLTWSALDRSLKSLDLGKEIVSWKNNSGLFDVYNTIHYSVRQISLTSLSIQCVAVRSDSGLVLSVAKASLNTDSESIYYPTHGSNVGFIWMLPLIIFLLLIVIFLNWNMYKKLMVKSNPYRVDRPTDGHIEMALTRNTYVAERGSPLSFGRNVQNGEQVPPNNQSDSFDSGTLSNSQQLNEDEADEKHEFLDGGCPNTKEQDPSDVNQRTFGDAQVV